MADLVTDTRERVRTGLNPDGGQVYWPDDRKRMLALCDEVERLRARLADAERLNFLHAYRDSAPPISWPSDETVLWEANLRSDALTASEVARLLNVGVERARQRASQGTLYVMPSVERRLLFPRFQFTDDGVLPGWKAVCKRLPVKLNPAAVEYFLTRKHPDFADGVLTPQQWLAAGRPPEPVVSLAERTFGIRWN